MPTRPITGPLTRSPSGGVTGVGGGASLSAFSAAKYSIQQNSADVNILVIGDSTGDFTDEWVYLLGQWLATEYPTHSVSYRLWNDTGNVYDAAVSLGTGSGANTIRIWNASIGGTIPASMMRNAKYAAGIEAVPANLIIWNHGHNLYTADPNLMLVLDSYYSPWLEKVQATHPSASMAILTQNPRRDDDNYASIYAMQLSAAADKLRLALVDTYSRFVAAGKPSGWYADNVHPSATGQSLGYLSAIQSAWRSAAAGQPVAAESWLATTATNLIPNGDFASWAGANPDSWTVGGTATATKELTIVDTGDTYSAKIEQTGASQANMRQVLSAPALAACKAAGRVSFAVRRYMPASADMFTGQIQVLVTAGTNVSRTAYVANVRVEDSWHWMFLRDVPVPADATAITCYCYASAAVRSGAVAYFGRAIAVAGDIPRDMA